MDSSSCVKVAVRIRPLSEAEVNLCEEECIVSNPIASQICAGTQVGNESPSLFTFDHTFASSCTQESIYNECVRDLVSAAFEGFNATILAYGQTGSGKTWTMGSSSDLDMEEEKVGIIPRVIRNLFIMVGEREDENPNIHYKMHVQFLEIYGEDIKDLLDATKTSKVIIRETSNGEVSNTRERPLQLSHLDQIL